MGIKPKVILLALALTGTTIADTVISFASLSQPGSGMFGEGGSVSADGFTFASQDNALEIWEASNGNLPNLSPANTSLFEFFSGSTTTVSDGGSPFTLKSIDLAPLIAGGSGTFTVGFIGTLANSSTVSQTFTVTDSTPTQLQTFAFTGFNNLVNVKFSQGTNFGFFGAQDTAYQFDNVVVSQVATPEPNLLVLVGIGLLCLIRGVSKRAVANR